MLEVSVWLHRWCQWEWFLFLADGMGYQDGGLLARGGLSLKRRGRNVSRRHLTHALWRIVTKSCREQKKKAREITQHQIRDTRYGLGGAHRS